MQDNGRGRFWLGVLIACIAVGMYMCQTQENPVTGEKQHVTMSTDQEIKLGLESAPEMAKQMGGEVPASDPRTQEVEKIGRLLWAKSEAKNSPWKFDFHLLEDPKTVNAFALPGGQVFITLGLYDKLQNEAQLAGVLGHEMGHVIERHSAEQMATSQLGNLLVVAVVTGSSGDKGGSNSPAVIAATVNQMFQLHYSRKDESEADVWGLKLMVEAGFNPEQMIQVMEVLKKAAGGGGRGPDFFQSHPNPDLRIEQIKAYLQKNPPPKGLTNGSPLNTSQEQAPEKTSSWW